jgi:hypothetical protein
MTTKGGIGVTEISHDREARIEVLNVLGPRTYQRSVTYEINMEKIVAIINTSKYCEQFIKYDCNSVCFYVKIMDGGYHVKVRR